MVFADLDPSLVQLGGKENDEGIAAVFLELRPLVLVLDVLQRQRMELERLFQQRVVRVIGILDIQPEAALAFRQARRDVARNGLDLGALGCDEVAGYLISAEAPASLSFFRTPSASSRLMPCLTGFGA
jgi:hypothetical protein